MSIRKRDVVGLSIGAVAALWWAVAMTIQETAEPFDNAESATYWLRDVRWLCLLAIAVVFVWTFRGDAYLSGLAAAGLVIGVAADVMIDATDTAYGRAIVMVLLGGWLIGMKREIKPNPRISAMAAAVGGAGTIMVSMLESPSGSEWSLIASVLLLGAILTVAALGCALDAGGDSLFDRLIAVTALIAAAVLLAGTQYDHTPTAFLSATALCTGLASAVALLVLRRRAGLVGGVIVAILAAPVAVVSVVGAMAASMAVNSGSLFTWLAGNSAVTADADDISLMLVALVAGLVVGAVVVAGDAVAGSLSARRRAVTSAA